MEKKKQQLPPDEHRCSQADNKGWRCKNFRMNHDGAAAADDDTVPRTKLCEKHYNHYDKKRKMKTSGDSDDGTSADIHGGSGNVETKTKLPPDEQRCVRINGGGIWRCKNFRMGHGFDDSVPKSDLCEKHYDYFVEYRKRKKRSGDGEGAGSGPIDETKGSGKKKVTEEEENDLSLDNTDAIDRWKKLLSCLQSKMEKKKKMQQLPPDEHRCSLADGSKGWRCMNYRMGHGAADDDNNVPKSKYCEKHYTCKIKYKRKQNKTSGDHGEERNKVTEEEDDTSHIQGWSANVENKTKKKLPPDEHRCGKTNGDGWRCKNFRMSYGAAVADDDTFPKSKFCEKHYNDNKYRMKKKTSGDGEGEGAGSGPVSEMLLPPDEHRCSLADGSKGWRCMNYRMGHGAAADDNNVPKSKYCEKHYTCKVKYKRKKNTTSGDGEGAGSGPVSEKLLPPDEECCCHTDGKGWRCKDFRMNHGADDDHSVPKTNYCEKHHNHFAEMNLLRKKSSTNGDTSVIGAKRTEGSGELKSSTKTVVETRASKRRKNVTEGDRFVVETSNQPATDDNCHSDTIVGGGSDNNMRKRKHVERMSRELESLSGTREAAAELESLEHHKSKSVELEKKKAECTELVKKAKKKKPKKTTSIDENEQTLADATERWKKLLSCLQSKVNEKSTSGCGESHILNLESLVFRSGKESSILRCVELGNSERVDSEVPGLQNHITQSCEGPTDESNNNKLNAETSIGGRKDSHVYESKATDKVLNVCDLGVNEHHEPESEFPKYCAMNILKRSTQHGSSSQDHLEMSTEPFANLVSDEGGEQLTESEDFGSPVNSKNSFGDPMDMLAMKNWKRNNDEMKWKSEPDMLSSFEDEPEICLKAICALYRQEISEDPISPKGLYFDEDTLRCTTLAKFLMDEDSKS